MSSQAGPSSFVLTRRLADGTVEWIPLEIPERVPVGAGEHYALIDRADYEAPQTLVARRQGEDLTVEVQGTEVLVLDGFFATADVAFYPTTDIAGGAGPFSGSPLTPDSPVLTGSPPGEQVVWTTEPGEGEQVVRSADAGGGDSGSALLWGGLAAGGLGLALAAGGGGGGGGGGTADVSGDQDSDGDDGADDGDDGDDGGDQDDSTPSITSGATAEAIDENSGAGQVVYNAEATDDGPVTWSLEDGDDAADFGIDADTGEVTLTENPDHEVQPSYSFTVVATDADGNRSTQAVSLAINDLDEVAPSITSGATAAAIDENSGAGQVIYTVTSSDDGDVSTGSTTYGLSPADDADHFSIDADTGAVTLVDDPDFETKSSYTFTVVATDAAGNSSEQAVSLAINDVDEAAPRVVEVALTGAAGAQNDILNAGDVVTVTVTMSEDIDVDTSGGTPRIALSIGGTTVFADYVSGSGSTSLIFEYTIQPGDTDSNGISIPPNSLETNGGSLTDSTGVAADLEHGPVSNDASFIVDTTAPDLSSSTPADDATDVAVDDDIVLTFSEDVQIGSGNITISNGSDIQTIDVTDDSQVSISGNQVTINPASDLEAGSTYNVQIDDGALTDAAGNAYAGTTLTFDTETDTSIVVFDLVQGSSSDHSDRTFDSDVSYDIYIRVESEDATLSTDGTWGIWRGAESLGSDDRIILVGDGEPVEGPFGGVVDHVSVNASAVAWQSSLGFNAGVLRDSSFTRNTGLDDDEVDSIRLFQTSLPGDFLGGQGGQTNTMYLTSMPAGLLTSQGLV